MLAFIVRRILIAIPTLGVVSFALFAILYSAGDPIARLRGQKLDPNAVNAILEANGFNDPFLTRYWHWLSGFVTGDWGVSFQTETPAFDEIMEKFPATLELLGVALIVTLLIALPIGIYSATHRYSTFDSISTGFSYAGFATPTFFVGLLLQLMAVELTQRGWGILFFVLGTLLVLAGLRPFLRDRFVPTLAVGAVLVIVGLVFWDMKKGESLFFTGKRFSATVIDPSIFSVDHLQHLVLPVITITVISIATWSRYLRSSMLDVMSQDYLRTARAKGVGERRVIYKHALRNGTLPLITIMAIDAAAFFQGAIITETVFSWDGIGSRMLQAVREQDIPVSMGIVMIGSFMVVLFNTLADVAYAVADPRIRLS